MSGVRVNLQLIRQFEEKKNKKRLEKSEKCRESDRLGSQSGGTDHPKIRCILPLMERSDRSDGFDLPIRVLFKEIHL